MRIHRVQVVETGDQSTAGLVALCLGFRSCAKKGRWPDVTTANALLSRGIGDGELGTDIKWDAFELTSDEYQEVISTIMGGRKYTIDGPGKEWDDWLDRYTVD